MIYRINVKNRVVYCDYQGKDVFAVPGEVKSDTSIGANNLIKQGAKLVDNVDDILEELNIRSLM